MLTAQQNKPIQFPSQMLFEAIIARRRVIRDHRDAKGDDRCWLDDYLVWNMVSDAERSLQALTAEEGMRRCILFYEYRRTDVQDPVPKEAILDQALWDKDLLGLEHQSLLDRFYAIQAVIWHHQNVVGRHRTMEDDRQLYAILPEKIPADFRLPPRAEFLERAKEGAGCPNFWISHATCSHHTCNLHQWGPCRKIRLPQ